VQWIRDLGNRIATAGELLGFLWHMKMWWMIPMVFVLLLIGLFIGFGSATGAGPFIYTLF
jgi:hypothetical protein